MKKIHFVKITPHYYAAVADLKKRCEIRYNDRDFKVNEGLILMEFDGQVTGRYLHHDITHVLSCYPGLTSGYAALSLSDRIGAGDDLNWQGQTYLIVEDIDCLGFGF